MYDLNDTVVAVSSPTPDKRVIIRITGPETFDVCRVGLAPPIEFQDHGGGASPTLHSATLAIDEELEIDTTFYLFKAPNSYTGEDVAEIHIYTNRSVTQALIDNLLLRKGRVRMAEPGEFTARAYLNGRIDLAQAEAVNEIIVSSNEYQLAAAERLLEGRLGQTIAKLRDDLLECLSLIEGGLDFSGEDMEFISRSEAIDRITTIRIQLEQLLAGSIGCETLVDMPAVGIAGAPNAGKSRLLNRLLGKERSIVSSEHKTTRDVLAGVWSLPHCACVLFDCAGLLTDTDNILDELSQEAAVEALRNSDVVIFCADLAKADWDDDLAIRRLIRPKDLVPVATKCDLLDEGALSERLDRLNGLFGEVFMPVCAQRGTGIEMLQNTIDGRLVLESGIVRTGAVAMTARHKAAVTEAIENVGSGIDELKSTNDEIATMMLRTAYQAFCCIDSGTGGSLPIDEYVLSQIFSRFCVGK